MDILLKVKEKGKQSIGLTGGISGIAGSFIGLNYQTNNFLGLGETLTFSAEFGDRQRNFIFGFTEPYFLDRPISSGFTVFSSRFSFDQARETSILLGQRIQLDPNSTQNYDQDSKGFTVFASYPLRRFAFTRVAATYGLTKSSIRAFSDASRILFETLQFRNFAGPSAVEGILSSRLVPSITHNTVDHPINPTRGKSFFYSASVEGGPLGGNINTLTHVMEAKYFRPINKRRNVIGLRLLASVATGYGGKVLPPNNRFYMGGEDTIRGYDIRTITPIAFIPVQTNSQITFVNPSVLDANGNPQIGAILVPTLDYSISFPGGDTQGVLNAEYRIPLVGPVGMSIFTDIGLNGVWRRKQLRLNDAFVADLRTSFPTANISDFLELSPGSNFRPRISSGVEFVVQLPVVNAPFRIYWAYNFNRLNSIINEPAGLYRLDENDPNVLPGIPPTTRLDILRTQIFPQLDATVGLNARRLNFFEPLKTFRFTVSRTF